MNSPVETNPRERVAWFHYLAGILAVIGASLIVPTVSNAVFKPNDLHSELAYSFPAKLLIVILIWVLIRLRGERLADIGLKTPESWVRAILIGFASAAVVFVVIYASEKSGIHRNLTAFQEVRGNLALTLFGIAFSFVGAGFYEEFVYRGFYFQSMAMLFGRQRASWAGACLLQGAIFGMDHSYQGTTGIVMTGLLGVALGFIFLSQNRNLWPVIIGHGLYDAARFVLFYFQGPPVG